MEPERARAVSAATRIPTCVAKAELLTNRTVATDTYLMELKLPVDWPTPEPGQFVSITIEDDWQETQSGETGDALLRRPFCLYGSESRDDCRIIEILFTAVGKVTKRLACLEPGALVDVLGPRGTAFPLLPDCESILIGGGRGIAPFIFTARELRRKSYPFQMLYGARSADQLVALDEFAELTTTITDDGSSGRGGTVIDLLMDCKIDNSPVLLACGPHGMLRAVAQFAAQKKLECWVSLEEVFGCSMGICGGCAVPAKGDDYERYIWACRQGPVVDATRIDWNG
jgi:dihydroorotate dehydrogenase electron transfer subunit